MKVKELLSDESKWTKGAYARNALGRQALVEDSEAVCWCFEGAIMKCYGDILSQVIEDKILAKISLQNHSIITWNDDSERTFAEVKALVEELDI